MITLRKLRTVDLIQNIFFSKEQLLMGCRRRLTPLPIFFVDVVVVVVDDVVVVVVDDVVVVVDVEKFGRKCWGSVVACVNLVVWVIGDVFIVVFIAVIAINVAFVVVIDVVKVVVDRV